MSTEDEVDDDRLAGALPSRVARTVSAALTPAVLVAALTAWVCLRRAPSVLVGIGWWAAVVGLVIGVPYLYLWREVRAGRVLDHHMVRRSQRTRTLVVAAVSVLGAPLLALAVGAPRSVVAVPVAMLAALLVVLAVTTRWKVSIHLTVAGAVLAIVGVPEPRAALLLAPLAALLSWARVREGRHTYPQVVAGLVLGAVVAGTAFAILR